MRSIQPSTYRNLLTLLFICLVWMASQAQDKNDPLEDSLQLYKQKQIPEKALFFSDLLAQKAKSEKGENSEEYGWALCRKGLWMVYSGKQEEAAPILNKGLEIQKNSGAPNPEHISNSYYAMYQLHKALKQFQKGEESLLKKLAEEEKNFGPNSAQVARTNTQLGTMYYVSGDYKRAEERLLKSFEIQNSLNPKETPEMAEVCRFLGIVYKDVANFPKVEYYFNIAFSVCLKVYGTNHVKTGEAYNNIGAACSFVGNYEKALEYYLKALVIRIQTQGPESDEVGQSYLNLANLYQNLGRKQECLESHEKAISILSRTRGPEDDFVGYAYLNAAGSHAEYRNLKKASEYGNKARQILVASEGENHPDIALVDIAAAELNFKMGQFDQVIHSCNKALELWRKVQGPHFVGCAQAYLLLASSFTEKKDYKSGAAAFKAGNALILEHFYENFPGLSDEEKEALYASKTKNVEAFKSFCGVHAPRVPGISGDLYDFQLATKGILVNSSAKWKHRIKYSGDVKLFNQYTRWLEYQKQISALQQSPDSSERAGLDSLLPQSNKLEKELSKRSEIFAKLADRRISTWKDVRKVLKPGEAAVEIIRTKKYGITQFFTDTTDFPQKSYPNRDFTDTIIYVVLIVRPESVFPDLVILQNGNEMEGKALSFYQNSIRNQVKSGNSFSMYWEKIHKKLLNVRRVYFSPDGVFHKINLNTLWNPASGKYVIDEKDIRLVTTTKDLLKQATDEPGNKLASLVGFPSYYSDKSGTGISENTRKSPQLKYGLRLTSFESLADLPSTKEEVLKIETVLKEKGWDVQSYLEDKALEDNLKESYKPGLLHIATHGYFQPDSTGNTNPLLSSGLFLSGAGNTLKGTHPSNGEDGILTAYEAMNLNLDNTSLVVLSACETGLGEIRNGEGVYGLQRAFKVAGAKSLIMSLWKVDDEATQELMVSFYKHWLGPPASKGGANTSPPSELVPISHREAGGQLRSAFLAAQKELKARYPGPYYWGAFVMVSE